MSYWERQVQSRLSRRRVLQVMGVGGAGLAAATLLACGSSGSKGGSGSSAKSGTSTGPFNTGVVSSSDSGDEVRARFGPNTLRDLPGQKNGPKYGGIHKKPQSAGQPGPPTWDWTSPAASSLGFFGYTNNCLMSLEVNDNAKDLLTANLEPMLAKSWERAGTTTLVLHLDENAKWHNVAPVNGRPFTSEDVAYNIEAYKKAPVQQFIYRDVDKVETPDKNTVRLVLRQPAAYLEQQLATPYNVMFAREHAESADGLAKRPIGTSAFIWESQQDRVDMKLTKNKEFWRKDARTGKQLPYLDGIIAYYFADVNSNIAAFHAKQIDSVSAGDRIAWESIIQGHPDYVSMITPPPPGNQPNMAMRLDKAPWNDIRVRRAMSMGIDRQLIAKAFGELGMASFSQDWSYMGFKQPWTWEQMGQYYKYNLTEAKALLSAAGLGSGFGRKIGMDMPAVSGGIGYDIPVLVNDAWRRNLGLEIDLKPFTDQATFNRAFFGRQYQEICANTYYTLGFEPDEMSYGVNHSKAPSNFGFVNDPTMDDLVTKQGNELDKNARVKLLQEIMNRDVDQVFHMWTVALNQINVRQPYLYGITSFLYGGPTSVSSHSSQYAWLDV